MNTFPELYQDAQLMEHPQHEVAGAGSFLGATRFFLHKKKWVALN